MRFDLRSIHAGLWEVVGPAGRVVGLAPSRRAGLDTIAGLQSFLAFSSRDVA